MSNTEQHPDLAVIDLAIKRIAHGQDIFSCVALSMACRALHPQHEDWVDYRWQYDQYICGGGDSGRVRRKPRWWDSFNHGSRNRQSRIAALKRFGKACIRAAARQGKS